jgi:hypothetical protein
MKTFIQKAFEKVVMLERNEELSIALAKDSHGNTVMVVGLSGMENSFTPIARLLPERETDSMTPMYKEGKVMDEWFKKVRADLKGKISHDFSDAQHPLLTEEAVNKHLTDNQID